MKLQYDPIEDFETADVRIRAQRALQQKIDGPLRRTLEARIPEMDTYKQLQRFLQQCGMLQDQMVDRAS